MPRNIRFPSLLFSSKEKGEVFFQLLLIASDVCRSLIFFTQNFILPSSRLTAKPASQIAAEDLASQQPDGIQSIRTCSISKQVAFNASYLVFHCSPRSSVFKP